MDDLIEKKVCNALIKGARPGFGAYLVTATSGPSAVLATAAVLAAFKKVMGGLWVGGTAYLTSTKLGFESNALNNFFHEQDYAIEIPLSEVESIERKFGFVTGIIQIETPHGILKVRCTKADQFADQIRHTRKNLK